MKHLFLLLLTSTLFLTSCGNQAPNIPKEEVKVETINGIVVPPEPDPVKNNATLAGIDSNSNGVRDDVERDISLHITKDKDFYATIKVATAYQNMLIKPLPKDREEALLTYREVACTKLNNKGKFFDGDESLGRAGYLVEKTFNTDSRKDKYADFRIIIGGLLIDEN